MTDKNVLWVVAIDLGQGMFGNREVKLCGVFDALDLAEEYRAERSYFAGRDVREYRIVEVERNPAAVEEEPA